MTQQCNIFCGIVTHLQSCLNSKRENEVHGLLLLVLESTEGNATPALSVLERIVQLLRELLLVRTLSPPSKTVFFDIVSRMIVNYNMHVCRQPCFNMIFSLKIKLQILFRSLLPDIDVNVKLALELPRWMPERPALLFV